MEFEIGSEVTWLGYNGAGALTGTVTEDVNGVLSVAYEAGGEPFIARLDATTLRERVSLLARAEIGDPPRTVLASTAGVPVGFASDAQALATARELTEAGIPATTWVPKRKGPKYVVITPVEPEP